MEIIITSDALRRLANQLDFLYEELSYSKKKIIDIEQMLLSNAYNLKFNPRIGQFEGELSHLNKGYRRIIVGKFKIIYRIEKNTVHVTDFFDTRQEPSKIKA